MQFSNKILIASAGSGKTTEIVEDVLTSPNARHLVTTFTLNNANEIKSKFFELNGCVPEGVTIMPWFTFLIREFARPYQNYFFDQHRVDSLNFVSGRSDPYAPKSNPKRYFFGKSTNIYSDKLAEFCCECDNYSGGRVLKRLEQLYSDIHIDEVQDLAGYDLEIIELMLKADVNLTLVGDHRQATFTTNQSAKNKKYRGVNITKKFDEWKAVSLCKVEYRTESHRCVQQICNLADRFFPDFPSAESKNTDTTSHDGVFVISSGQVDEYLRKFHPQILRYNRTEKCQGLPALNFGDSKGLTFNRVLIFPHGPLKKLIKSGNFDEIKTPALMYVAFTRARQSVVVVCDEQDIQITEVSRLKF